MKNNEDKIKVEKSETCFCCQTYENLIEALLDEIVSISNNYNIDIHDGDSNYNYYKNEFININKGE